MQEGGEQAYRRNETKKALALTADYARLLKEAKTDLSKLIQIARIENLVE